MWQKERMLQGGIVGAIVATLALTIAAFAVPTAQGGTGEADCPEGSTLIDNFGADASSSADFTFDIDGGAGSVTVTNNTDADVFLVVKGGPDQAGGEAVLIVSGASGTAFTPMNPNNDQRFGVSNFSLCAAGEVSGGGDDDDDDGTPPAGDDDDDDGMGDDDDGVPPASDDDDDGVGGAVDDDDESAVGGAVTGDDDDDDSGLTITGGQGGGAAPGEGTPDVGTGDSGVRDATTVGGAQLVLIALLGVITASAGAFAFRRLS